VDGSGRWVHVPNRREHARDPLALEYYRRLSITESVNQLSPAAVAPLVAAQRRLLAGELRGFPSPDEIARHLPGVPQYRVPTDNAQRLLGSYAHFVAGAYPHADPGISVASVKVYRVVHGLVPPGDFADGRDPRDPTLYQPYYQGEFDRDGNLIHPNDPFLYWLLPVLRVQGPAREELLNLVALHAGSDPWEDEQ
jgi:hypothetical protein